VATSGMSGMRAERRGACRLGRTAPQGPCCGPQVQSWPLAHRPHPQGPPPPKQLVPGGAAVYHWRAPAVGPRRPPGPSPLPWVLPVLLLPRNLPHPSDFPSSPPHPANASPCTRTEQPLASPEERERAEDSASASVPWAHGAPLQLLPLHPLTPRLHAPRPRLRRTTAELPSDSPPAPVSLGRAAQGARSGACLWGATTAWGSLCLSHLQGNPGQSNRQMGTG